MANMTTTMTATAAQCFTIGATTASMPEFVGYPLFVDPQSGVKDTVTLDAYMFGMEDNSTEYQAIFRASYDCAMWDGSKQRFHMTFVQGYMTFLAQNSKVVSPCQGNANTNHFVCQSSCLSAKQSLTAIFMDPASCSQTPNAAAMAARQATLADFDAKCPLFPTTNCLTAVAEEQIQAGFPLMADGVAYCSTNGNDPLCSMLGGPPDAITHTLLIVGIALAAVVFGSMTGLMIYCLRSSVPKDMNGKFVDLDKAGNFNGELDLDNHKEPHFDGAEIIRDVVVGLSDGLTVPFALTAGLSSLGNSKFVVLAGVSELVAGSISMGLGGYLGGKSEIEHFNSEEAREWQEVMAVPDVEEQEIVDMFQPYGMDRRDMEPLLNNLRNNPELWVEFMMAHELNMEKPESSRLWVSALTVGGSYFMGGLVPLIPYMIVAKAGSALFVSIGSTLTVLFVFGFVKAKLIGVPNVIQSAFEMLFVGAGAAGAAFGVAKLLPTP